VPWRGLAISCKIKVAFTPPLIQEGNKLGGLGVEPSGTKLNKSAVYSEIEPSRKETV
jgi:hypothetical protein